MFETGIGIRNPLFFIGIVENANDLRNESRVQVRAFGVHGTKDEIPTEDLPWALAVAGNYNMSVLPQLNHWVFGVFLDGRDAQQPLVLGTIPTFMSDTLDTERDGVGAHPKTIYEKALNADNNPERVGQPPCHPLASGEFPHEQHPIAHEMGCVKDVRVGSNPNDPNQVFKSWSETSTAYNAKYPHNRVYDSPDGKTTIELDSTPNAERLMIWHRGSYIQVDANGTRTDKSYGDHQEVNDRNNMVYIGGRSSVTIMGDSHVYVDGNKIEEINGDLIQVVHGNHILGVGGQMSLNASEEVQIRAAQIRMESNVAGINLKAAKRILAESGESMHFKSGIAIFQEATNSINIKAGDNIYIQCDADFNIKAENSNIEASGVTNVKANDIRIGGGGNVSINASVVAIDDIITMANAASTAPDAAAEATAADPAEATEIPEPPAKSTSISRNSGGRNRPNVRTAGAASIDASVESAETPTSSVEDTSNYTPPVYPSDISQKEIEEEIRRIAREKGINEDLAVAIWKAEGRSSYQSRVPASGAGSLGGYEASFGPYQLYTGNGLGNEYEKRYGVKLVEDNTRQGIFRQIEFSLEHARKNGWGAWSAYNNGSYTKFL